MKKLIVALLAILSLTGCSNYTTYTELRYQELTKKLDNKDTFVLVFGSAKCSACTQYKVTMEKVIKNKNVEIFYIDLAGLDEADYAKVYSRFVVNSTPTTIFIFDGQEKTTYDRIVGSADYNEIVDTLKEQGFLGE